jgi:hypothetical protein
MNRLAVEKLADALLYEGCWLYPYRPSALKNQWRWAMGALFPSSWSRAHGASEPWVMQTECLVQGSWECSVAVSGRFLLVAAEPLAVDERRQIALGGSIRELLQDPQELQFRFPERSVAGRLELSALAIGDSLFRIRVRIENNTPIDAPEQRSRDEVLRQALVSAHLLVDLNGGQFVSLRDPPDELRPLAEGCAQMGAWPVLVGDPVRRDMLLAAPIILDDYPRVAPESPGDLFDATEIDELLTLRILTLSESEQDEIARGPEAVRRLLARSKELDLEQLFRLHGTIRQRGLAAPFGQGQRVRLKPQGRADVLDLALVGKTATIVSVEQDFEGQVHLCVTVDDDPGQDLGRQGQPGHRFFFRPEEVELLEAEPPGGP